MDSLTVLFGAPPSWYRHSDGAGTATVAVTGASCTRSFVLSSNAARRDDLPASPRTMTERLDRPSLSTRSDLFDALYQLALERK